MRVLFVGIVAALLTTTIPAQDLRPLTEDEKILHLLSRLTFGPTPGQFGNVKGMGLDKWIDQQLQPEKLPQTELEKKFSKYELLGTTPFEQAEIYRKMQEAKGEDDQMMQNLGRFRSKARDEIRAYVVENAMGSSAQLFEVLTDFWRNHFAVDIAKDSVEYTATHYEIKVIREMCMGRFLPFLQATATHPSMLVFLDNHISRRPPSKSELKQIENRYRRRGSTREQAKEQAQIAKQRGLNENYARELMELHTLGVDNGYSQEDVEMVARAFTGWSTDFGKDGTGFMYKDGMHDPSRKSVMGRGIPRGRRETGMIEGKTIIGRLAKHKNTANFIATKLVRYLVNDDPPPKIVAAAARTFKAKKGDIREVVRTIIKHPEFFDRQHFKAKFKNPLEFVTSALRATEADVSAPKVIADAVASLGMPIYGCEDPTGWDDTAEAWRDPGVMALRWRFALRLARGKVRGMKIGERFYYQLPEDPLDLMDSLIKKVVPQGLGSNTYAVLERVTFKRVQEGLAETERGRKELAKTIVGILLGSPEFQQQ